VSYRPSALTINKKGRAFFGDGSDGTVIIAVNTTLTRDMYYDNLTVDVGVILTPGFFRIFVKGTLALNGEITLLGVNATSSTGAVVLTAQLLSSGSSGGSSTLTGSGNGGVLSDALGGTGGNGGSSNLAGGIGGVAGTGTNTTGNLTAYSLLLNASMLRANTTTTQGGGGTGGGSGSGDGAIAGGGGGSGAGNIVICARTITGSGTLRSKGGNGFSPTNGGGGGGGGGGYIYILTEDTVPNTVVFDLSGGAAGAAGAGGNAGNAGGTGNSLIVYTNN
jgi:hypothetical protein